MRRILSTAAVVIVSTSTAFAQTAPVTTCDRAGIGSVRLTADGPAPTILDVSSAMAGSGAAAVPYCLVKVLVPQAINLWVGLPLDGKWNGKLQSLGGGGYAGNVVVPTAAWVERGEAPSTLTGERSLPGGATRTRPLCPYPDVAVWNGVGSTDAATSFTCRESR